MLPAAVIGALVLVALVVWARGRRQSPPHTGRADSDLRDAFVGLLMTVGPFFGVRHTPPRVEVPVATTPASDELDPAHPAHSLTGPDGAEVTVTGPGPTPG